MRQIAAFQRISGLGFRAPGSRWQSRNIAFFEALGDLGFRGVRLCLDWVQDAGPSTYRISWDNALTVGVRVRVHARRRNLHT